MEAGKTANRPGGGLRAQVHSWSCGGLPTHKLPLCPTPPSAPLLRTLSSPCSLPCLPWPPRSPSLPLILLSISPGFLQISELWRTRAQDILPAPSSEAGLAHVGTHSQGAWSQASPLCWSSLGCFYQLPPPPPPPPPLPSSPLPPPSPLTLTLTLILPTPVPSPLLLLPLPASSPSSSSLPLLYCLHSSSSSSSLLPFLPLSLHPTLFLPPSLSLSLPPPLPQATPPPPPPAPASHYALREVNTGQDLLSSKTFLLT